MSSSDSKDLYADVLTLIGVLLVGFYVTSFRYVDGSSSRNVAPSVPIKISTG